MSDTEDYFGGMGGVQSMGVLNALRTGDPRVDMIFAMCFPFVLKFCMDSFRDAWAYIKEHLLNWKPQALLHERRIVHKATRDPYGGVSNEDEDRQNTILIKAIDMYLHAHKKLDLMLAHVDLTSTEDKNAGVGKRNNHYYYYGEEEDEDEDEKTMVGALKKYKIVQRPPINDWHQLGEYGRDKENQAGVQLQIQRAELDSSGNEKGNSSSAASQVVTTYNLTSSKGEAIDAFIDTAYQWYLGELRKLEDNSRYLYELKSTSVSRKDEEDEKAGRVFTRYRLSDEKTFDSLFFREKESLLRLIGHFTNKTGKYSIQGYPHKLGLLLSGAPGSGKTSFIKALAQHTGRSIVNINLARITTNAELMQIFFNHRKYVEGENMPAKLGFQDVIYVMEDVDAASNVVKRRDGKIGRKDGEEVGENEEVEEEEEEEANVILSGSALPQPKSVWKMMLESNEGDCKELVEKLIEKSPRLKEEAARSEILTGTVEKLRALPGLGLVGNANNSDNPMLEKIGADALCTVNQIMEDRNAVEQYLASHARVLSTRIDQGAKVDDAFVDALLGNNCFGDVCVSQLKSKDGAKALEGVSAAAVSASSAAPESPIGGSLDLSALSSGDGVFAQLLAQSQAATEGSSTPTTTATSTNAADTSSPKDREVALVQGPTSSFGKKTFDGFGSWGKPEKDSLNLSGLLNVLDGVVDSPNRIVIMTTNHVEHLDPALIRPGRIDKKMFLSYMEAPDVISMLEHYFQMNLSDSQRERVERAMNGLSTKDEMRRPLSLTPAQIEQMTAEFDEIEDMIEALEAKGIKKSRRKKGISSFL